MISAAAHIDKLLREGGHYSLTDGDRAFIAKNGIEAWLYRCATSTKFRKWRLPEGVEERVRSAIAHAVANDEPLKFVFEFGGYKLWRIPTTPEVDWAEFFTFAHYIRYLAPMAAAYTPGVIFSFASDDYVVERMNNIPKASTDAYCTSFRALLAKFSEHLPGNLKVELVRLWELYENPADLESELAISYPATVAKVDTWSDVKREKMARKAELNFVGRLNLVAPILQVSAMMIIAGAC